MKKLHEIVAELEAELATCTLEDYPRVCMELCEHLAYVDSVRVGKYCNELLGNAAYLARPEDHALALCCAANSAMNQLDAPRADRLATEAWQIATNNGLEATKLRAQVEQVYAYLYSSKHNEAVILAEATHSNCLAVGHNELLLRAKFVLVHVYNNLDHAKAGIYAFDALELAKTIGKGWLIGYANFMLGYWARLLDSKTKDAYIYFEEAKKYFAEEGAKEYLLSVSITLVRGYIKGGDLIQALKVEQEALQLARELNNPRQTIIALYEIGTIYSRNDNIPLAEEHLNMAIALARENNNAYEEGTASTHLARLYEDIKDDSRAIEWFEKAQNAYGAAMGPKDEMAISNHLHKLYKRVGDNEKAYHHLLNYLGIKLKLQDEQRVKETTRLQQLYEKEKRESELQELKIKQQQTELEHAESELKAIRAQMNPHFIFNALNTIQSYIYLNDKQNASSYLGKFSRLTRMVLDMSNHDVVSLKDELEALSLYLQLERMRFEDVLNFEIALDGELDTESIKLPAMLVQPYVENAIKHGLLHKKDNRVLQCGFRLEGNKLIVSIDDNGIGRQGSAELKANRSGNHQSFATQANAKRFNLLNRDGDEAVGAAYTDKMDANGNPTGTLVVLTIPVQLDGSMITENV